MLRVDQHSRNNRQSFQQENIRAWTADADTGSAKYVALFNLRNQPAEVHFSWKQVGVPVESAVARDLWLHKSIGRTSGIRQSIPPHGALLYLLTH